MTDVLDSLQKFYKAQTIRDPMAIATYVKTRYGVPDKVQAIARGIAGKQNARQWNTVETSSDDKKKEATAGRMRGTKGGFARQERSERSKAANAGRKGFEGGRRKSTKKSIELDKAQNIKDSTRLADHLSRGGMLGAGEKKQASAPELPWHVYEGGMKDKDNAEKWNPIQDPDERGYSYDNTGKRLPKEGKKEKKKPTRSERAKAQKKITVPGRGSVFTTPEGTAQPRLPGFPRGTAAYKSMEKALEILKAHKFGGKPLGWDELPRDPISFSTNVMQDKGFKNTNLSANTEGAETRNKLARAIRELINEIPDATKKEIKQGKINDEKYDEEAKKQGKKLAESWKNGEHDVEKGMSLSPDLARILGFGAGWAMSDTFVEAPRGRMTPSQQREWERVVRTAMRRKKNLSKESIDALQTHYNDMSDTYVRRVPIENSLNIMKDHAPVPPRQGLVWDEQKKHWTRPEHVGHSVSEVQGKKRIRGTGPGIHEHSLKAGRVGGKGTGMSAEAGRRFRGAADVGVLKPHEAKHPSTHATRQRKRLVSRMMTSKRGKTRM